MKSIKVFLALVIIATITLMVFLSELHGFRLNMAETEKLFDEQLVDTAQLLSVTYSPRNDLESVHIDTKLFGFQIWKDGMVLLQSTNMPEELIANLEEGFQEHNFNFRRWRTYSYLDLQNDLWVLVAQRKDIRYSLAENIIIKSIIPALIILPLAGILIWSIIGFGVSPLRKLSDQLRSKRADDLSPLTLEKQPIELEQVVRSTNDLLSRLNASFQREKNFTADAAHELRTPISALKVHVHNLEKSLPSDDQNLQKIKSASDRMGHLIEQILILNKTSPEQFISRFTQIDIYKITQEMMAKEYIKFEKKNLNIELKGSSQFIDGDQFSLETLIHNLLENACKYTPENGSVLVTIKSEQGRVDLKIEDSGPGVPENQYDRLFDRFYRLDGDQHSSGEIGCGLGLAIVKHISDLHLAEIIFSHSAFQTGFSVTISFPIINSTIMDKDHYE